MCKTLHLVYGTQGKTSSCRLHLRTRVRGVSSAGEPNKRLPPQPTASSPAVPTLHSATTTAAAVAVSSVAPFAPRETCLRLPTFIAPTQLPYACRVNAPPLTRKV